uniref:PAAR domain-containing protein n=1 Tax=Paraburkholderia bannensis TaxID=765414 RepID=UPI002AC35884
MRGIVRVGDATSHGGRVETGSAASEVMGRAVARLVDRCVCLGFAALVLAALLASTLADAVELSESWSSIAESVSREPFVAQVVGLEWLNPLQRRDYPTEWQILWTLGLTRANSRDDMVRIDPQSFTALQSVAGIADGNNGRETFQGYHHKYIDELLPLFADRYAMNGKYFYTVQSRDKKLWRELAGIHIEYAIPTERLDPVEAQSYLRDRMKLYFEIGSKSSPDLWSKDTPPDVHVTPGGPNAGFTSLNKALDYLQANPDKSVWVMNWDAPSFPPKDGQINENMVLLILAG